MKDEKLVIFYGFLVVPLVFIFGVPFGVWAVGFGLWQRIVKKEIGECSIKWDSAYEKRPGPAWWEPVLIGSVAFIIALPHTIGIAQALLK